MMVAATDKDVQAVLDSLQVVYSSLMQHIMGIQGTLQAHIYTEAWIARIRQIVHEEVAASSQHPLATKTYQFQELPPELLQWMNRVEGILAVLMQQQHGTPPPPVSTPVQTQAKPASRASKRCVSVHTPDTLADTAEFKQCVDNGMSRTTLAKRFGVSESTIARAKRKLQR